MRYHTTARLRFCTTVPVLLYHCAVLLYHTVPLCYCAHHRAVPLCLCYCNTALHHCTTLLYHTRTSACSTNPPSAMAASITSRFTKW
eukprot:3590075-Pyramimonas_sp.AAC.1